ncbi:NAD-dependent succinate-semialdehyde dehydrogenase [Curtobacterium sp. S6]|uniref:NAD-dependent succinate-semialdehyde dehydrogenase n=1 Tax=Curtobacterium sp. S6 TaxID=1479623 RepID=UPI0004AA646A|nr:NAD-dependent succinate-semialdehyde dehydrogenase [Curtobacterium sp. S6]
MYAIINPASGQTVREFDAATSDEIEFALGTLHNGYRANRHATPEERSAALLKAAELFRERSEELAAVITQEMGKRHADATGEIEIVARIFEYYGTKGPEMLAERPVEDSTQNDVIQYRPTGVILGVMPWNYPLYQLARIAAPNLVLGNAVLIKPASSTPASGLAFADVLDAAGLGSDVYRTLLVDSGDIEGIIRDPRVAGVSLTGSEAAGATVAKVAGEELKKVVLELGGSDPFIVLDEENIDDIAALAVEARMENMGQACNSPKRFIVMEEAYAPFVASVKRALEGDYRPGDPQDPATTLGPLSSESARETIADQVDRAVAQGATLETGGHRLDREGFYYAPTLLTGVTPEMDVYHEELFGPVVVVHSANSDEECIRIANDSVFGLGGAVFGGDPERAEAVGEGLEVGMVSINVPGGTDAELPFGGVKRSGNGRELGRLGIVEFANQRLFRA